MAPAEHTEHTDRFCWREEPRNTRNTRNRFCGRATEYTEHTEQVLRGRSHEYTEHTEQVLLGGSHGIHGTHGTGSAGRESHGIHGTHGTGSAGVSHGIRGTHGSGSGAGATEHTDYTDQVPDRDRFRVFRVSPSSHVSWLPLQAEVSVVSSSSVLFGVDGRHGTRRSPGSSSLTGIRSVNSAWSVAAVLDRDRFRVFRVVRGCRS
jgi:hypothetical protein